MISLSNPEIVQKFDKLVRAVVNNLLLSYSIYNYNLDRDDLYQMGWVILLKCIDRFDPNRGVKFETFASRTIHLSIKDELTRKRYSPLPILQRTVNA